MFIYVRVIHNCMDIPPPVTERPSILAHEYGIRFYSFFAQGLSDLRIDVSVAVDMSDIPVRPRGLHWSNIGASTALPAFNRAFS